MTDARAAAKRGRTAARVPTAGSTGQAAAMLRAAGPMSRGDLGRVLGLSRTTVSATAAELIKEGWVEERAGGPAAARGRPATLLALTRRCGVAVGVDMGRTHARVVLAHLGHEVISERSIEQTGGWGSAEAFDAVADLVEELTAEAGVAAPEIVGVGLGLPAPLDGTGHSASVMIAPDWVGEDPGGELAHRLGAAVAVDNDANLGALAEARWGAGRGFGTLVYVKASTGIGAGLVIDGRLFRGSSGTAGEVGHVTVDDSGPVCRCGSRGCLEVMAGGPALVAQLSPGRAGIDTVHDLIAAARQGDLACARILADAGETLGVAVAAALNLFNPDRVVLGGELGDADDLVLASLRDSLGRHALASAVRNASVVPAQLGQRAEALGAVLLVLTEGERFARPATTTRRSAAAAS